MKRKLLYTLVAVSTLLIGGCDSGRTNDFTPQVAVSGLLTADELLGPVLVQETGPIDEFYDAEERAVNDATVRVHRLGLDGAIQTTYNMMPTGSGWYTPAVLDTVRGGFEYVLEVDAPGYSDQLRASTVVPEAFDVVSPPPAEVVYQLGPSPRFDVSRSPNESRQTAYILKVRALEPESSSLTPFAQSLVDDFDTDLEDLITSSSPILNEGNYDVNPDGTLRMSIVWFAFNFYGPQEIMVTALDDALVAFLESQAIQVIPTTLSPGEIPNVVSNVENGTGVWGSIAQAETSLTIVPPQ